MKEGCVRCASPGAEAGPGPHRYARTDSTTVPINQIRELRLGQPPTDNANASRWITVVYVRASQWKVLHMIALTDDVYKLWVSTLSKLVSETSDRMVGHATPSSSDPDTAWIRQLWPAGAKSIDWSVAVGLCRSIGLPVPQDMDGIQVGLRSATPLRSVSVTDLHAGEAGSRSLSGVGARFANST